MHVGSICQNLQAMFSTFHEIMTNAMVDMDAMVIIGMQYNMYNLNDKKQSYLAMHEFKQSLLYHFTCMCMHIHIHFKNYNNKR